MSVASARPRESLAGSTSLPAAGRFLLDLFDRFLIGRVRFRFADTEISSGTADGPETTLRIHDARVFARVVRFGNAFETAPAASAHARPMASAARTFTRPPAAPARRRPCARCAP